MVGNEGAVIRKRVAIRVELKLVCSMIYGRCENYCHLVDTKHSSRIPSSVGFHANLHGDPDDDTTLRLLRQALRSPPASSRPGLLFLARLPARPQAPVAACQAPVRSRLPNQSACRPAGVVAAQAGLLAQLPRRPARLGEAQPRAAA